MGTFSRFRHVVSANVNALLERAEDPEKLLRALIREMEDALDEAREAAAGIDGDRKQLERRIGHLDEEQAEWAARAEKAMDGGHEDLARQALARKLALAEEQRTCRAALQQAGESTDHIGRDIERLEQRLTEARERQKELGKKGKVERIPVVYRSPAERKVASVTARFEELESRMERLESRVEAYDIGRSAPAPLPAETNAEVEAELERLKQRLGRSEQPAGEEGA